MRYTIVKHDTLEKCVARVNVLIEEGWALQGGIAVVDVPFTEKGELSGKMIDGHERHYAQAMYHAGLKPTPNKAHSGNVEAPQSKAMYPT